MDQHAGLAHFNPRLTLGQPLDHRIITARRHPRLAIGGKLHTGQLDAAKQRIVAGELAHLERRSQRGQIPLGEGVQVFGARVAIVGHIELAAADNPVAQVKACFGVGRHEPAGLTARTVVETQHVIVEHRRCATLGKVPGLPLGFTQ